MIQRFKAAYKHGGKGEGWRGLAVPSVLSVVLFVLSVWGIGNFNQFLIYADEFGYWAASAYLTGADWRSVTGGIPYYSYGYGFLILAPIRLLFTSAKLRYQAAIVANALLLVGSYWIARAAARQIFEKTGQAQIDVLCLVAMLYPSNIVYAHITWSECMLVFLFWVFVWLSLRVMRQPSIWNHIGIAAISAGLYMVHQRTLAVAVSTAVIMVWCFFTDRSRRKGVLLFAAVLAVLLLLHSWIKEDLIHEFYRDNSQVAMNNFEGQTDKLRGLLTWEGFRDLLYSMAGKWFYLFVSTFMMAWWGAQALFRNGGSYLKRFFLRDKGKKGCPLPENTQLWYIWLLLAFAGNFLIAAIFLGYGRSNDFLLYGRYTEYMIGIYFLIGIMEFLEDQAWLPKVFACAIAAVGFGGLCQYLLDISSTTSYEASNSVCTSLFLAHGSTAERAALAYAFGGIAISLCIMLFLKENPWRKPDRAGYGVALLAVLFLYVGISFHLVLGRMTYKQCLRDGNIKRAADWILQMDEEGKQKVYYCADTEVSAWAQSFQFLLKERPLTVITTGGMVPEEDAFYIVGDDFVQSEGFQENFFCIRKTNQFAIIVKKDGELAEKAREFFGEQ